jgi:hypothetical protein
MIERLKEGKRYIVGFQKLTSEARKTVPVEVVGDLARASAVRRLRKDGSVTPNTFFIDSNRIHSVQRIEVFCKGKPWVWEIHKKKWKKKNGKNIEYCAACGYEHS